MRQKQEHSPRGYRWPGRHITGLIVVLMSVMPALAWAGGGNAKTAMLKDILVLLAVIGVAYVTAHLFIDRIQKRFGIATGIEYIIIGVLVGPVFGFLTPETISKFTPALVLGTGSLGLLTGLRMDFRRFERKDIEGARITMWVSLVTILSVVVLPLVVMYYVLPREELTLWIPGLMCTGAVALVADMRALESMRQFLLAKGGFTDIAVSAGRFCQALGVIGFGLLFCLFNPVDMALPKALMAKGWVQDLQSMPSLLWLGIHILIGSLMGIIFGAFLRRDYDGERLLTIVIGIVVFTSGLAYFLHLSPIFLNFILGIVLVNTNKNGRLIETMLEQAERPLYITLFFFAGASAYLGVPAWAYGVFIVYLILRSMGRILGGFVAMRTGRIDPTPPPLGRVLLAPGALSVAMLLDFQSIYVGQKHTNTIYAALLVAVVASEVLSYIRTKSWLIDFTDVQPEKIRRAMSGERLEVN